MDYGGRLARLRELVAETDFDLLAVMPGPTLFYLTGLSFHLSERPILGLFSPERAPRLVATELERVKIEGGVPDYEHYFYGESPSEIVDAFQRALHGNPRIIGVEPLRMRFFESQLLRQAGYEGGLVSAGDTVTRLRLIKDEKEIAAMQRAAEIAEQALREAMALIRVGMTELELASELTVQLLRAGSEPRAAFEPIVASGPNAAMPHAFPTDRRLQAGDALIIDWGARVDGYISDITRTFAVAESTPELAELHDVVVAANAAGREAVRAGVTADAVDRETRDVIEARGHGGHIVHRTGHGIGLEGHEPPSLELGNHSPLEAGMVVTIEPGIYLPGQAGIRVEDDVIVTEDGGRSLTAIPRELEVVG